LPADIRLCGTFVSFVVTLFLRAKLDVRFKPSRKKPTVILSMAKDLRIFLKYGAKAGTLSPNGEACAWGAGLEPITDSYCECLLLAAIPPTTASN